MIKIENVVMPSPEQWTAVIRGMRNPKNSWDLSDSFPVCYVDKETGKSFAHSIYIGPNDKKLMKNLANSGSDHSKYRRMIPVYLDIVAPLYWWKEFDTYKVGTVANSCSTMHKIHAREFTEDDFSFENLGLLPCGDGTFNFRASTYETIEDLNIARGLYNETKDKQYFDIMIQLLPSSYNQRRTVMLNYEVLANIYHARKNHKLAEWHVFCKWIEDLPHSDLIIGG